MGFPYLCFKDSLKSSLKPCSINPNTFKHSATDRAKWRKLCHQCLNKFEWSRISHIKVKKLARKCTDIPVLKIHCIQTLLALNVERYACRGLVWYPINVAEDTTRIVTDCSGHIIMYVCMISCMLMAEDMCHLPGFISRHCSSSWQLLTRFCAWDWP